MRSTQDVLDRHLKCFAEGDLDGILSDYADDAVVFTPEATLKSQAGRKEFFGATFEEFGKPGMTFDMKHVSVVGPYAYIHWTAETADNVYEVGTDTFVIRDGKITCQTFGGKITPK